MEIVRQNMMADSDRTAQVTEFVLDRKKFAQFRSSSVHAALLL